jgi:hypothetical protein
VGRGGSSPQKQEKAKDGADLGTKQQHQFSGCGGGGKNLFSPEIHNFLLLPDPLLDGTKRKKII